MRRWIAVRSSRNFAPAPVMAAWLDRAGPFKTVTQPDSALSAKYRLEATVTELYGDSAPAGPQSGRLPIHIFVPPTPLFREYGSVIKMNQHEMGLNYWTI